MEIQACRLVASEYLTHAGLAADSFSWLVVQEPPFVDVNRVLRLSLFSGRDVGRAA